ncbi:TonB-dependent receptor domain-containing protein [Arcticibacter sp. MXS-1]|uniref:TonB-dependent receptor n=1 Tax=Arcticibacter sp. MXS-1 TaxID=3341726 RepID=UPI0035A8C93E
MKTRLFYFLLIFLLLPGAGRLMAQIETTASISGQVTDDQGPLAGATVIALHQPSGSSYSTTSRGDGRYNLPNLRIGGPYIVKVTFVGYHVAQQELAKLALGQNYTVNLRLSPNSATLQEVVVSGKQSKIINSGRTGASQNISRTQIQNLPTQNRSFVDFVKLTPQFSLQYNNPSFAGRSNLANNFTVDGALFNNAFGLQGTIGSQTNSQPINMDAFEEISVNIAPYDVRQSGFTGAAINAVTRSGTNEFQGSLNYYTRSQNLVSKKIYTGVKSPVGNFDLKGYGFTAGGPIIKNKLFFFLSGELERRTDPGTSFIASRNGSTGPNVANVKGEDLDALSTYLQSLGYNPGPYENYSLDQNSDKFSVKLDYNINSRNTLTAKYFYFRSYKDILPSNSGAPGNSRQPSRNSLPFQSAGYGINNNMDNVNLELRTRFSSKLSNQLTLGYNRMRDFRESKGNKPFPLVDIKNPGGSAYTSFGYEPFTAFNKLNTDVLQITDNVSFYTGKHEFTLGGNFEHYKTLNGFAPNYYGAYVFNSMDDFYKSARDGVSNAALYKVQYSVLPGGSFPYARLRTNLLGFYLQDAYSVNDDLKITAGLRADLPMIKVMDKQKNENVANLLFASGERLDVSKFPKTSILWSPRVGFNYNVNGEGTTQLRGDRYFLRTSSACLAV